jgi:hypothetical protein
MPLIKDLVSPVIPAQGPARPATLRLGPLGRFDYWSLGLIALIAVVMLARIDHLAPSMSDTWYHLGIAHRIVDDGQVPGWVWWNYAPLGRPNLYPPLLHLLIAACAKLRGSIIGGGELCAALFLPCALLTTWYCARRLLSSGAALLAILLLLTDLFHFVIMESYIASCIVNILLPLLVVAFLARRKWLAIVLLTLMYYAHPGFPHAAALGLLLFGFKYRTYWRQALEVVAIGLLFFAPWLIHTVANADWLAVLREAGMPGGLLHKMFTLQVFNVLVLGLGIWGIAKAPRTSAARMLPIYMLVGYLPFLISYGGRYFMHTLPMWAFLGASAIGGILRPRARKRRGVLLPPVVRTRRLVGLCLLTLLPLPPAINVMKDKPGLVPLTGADLFLVTAFSPRPFGADQEKSEAYLPDCDELAQWLREHTRPDEIVHVNTMWVADMVSLLADRATDSGAWWECSKESAKLYGSALRDWDPAGVFVCIKPENDAGSVLFDTQPMPGVDRKFAIGRFDIGIRDSVRTKSTGRGVAGWQVFSAPGASGEIHFVPGGFLWAFPAGQERMSMIVAPWQEPRAPLQGPRADGISFRIWSSEMTGDLALGIKLADGADLRWPISVPEAKRKFGVRALFRRMTDEKGNMHAMGPIREVYLARPPEKPGQKTKRKEWRVEVTDLQLLTEVK